MKSTLSKLSSSRPNINPNPTKTHLLHTTQKLHSHHLKSGTLPEQLPHLFHCYCQSSEFPSACRLFDETPHWDLVSASAAVGSLARRSRHRDAISLFSRFPFIDIRPNQFTFGTILHSSTALADANLGKQLHSSIIKMGLHSNVFVGSSLVNLYAKLGSVEETQVAFDDTREPNVVSYTALVSGYLRNGRFEHALRLFRRMPERNVVSWNAMIGGCSQIGLNEESMNLFVEMCRDGTVPSPSTYPCVLTAAANVAALGLGRSFHASAIKFLPQLDVYVGNSLISLYSKSGSLEDSVLVFDRMRERNVVSWNAMICGFAQNGKGGEALEFYRKMRVSGLRPNGVTLLAVLFGCNHAGLVDEGYNCFKLAREEEPVMLKAEHYACVVDLLSRSGRYGEAERFLEDLPFEPGIGFWKALLGGSVIHWKKDLVEAVASRILALDPKDISSYVMLSNVYSAAGNWESASMIRREMKEKGMKRTPGCSWIELRSNVHVFTNGDRRHLQAEQIYTMLNGCLSSSSNEGYVG